MREEVDIYSCPTDEQCTAAPYETKTEHDRAFAECERYIVLIKKLYPEMPSGVHLAIKLCPYYFNRPVYIDGYYDVVASFSSWDNEAKSFAYHLQDNPPKRWDDTEAETWHFTPEDEDNNDIYLDLDEVESDDETEEYEDFTPIVGYTIIDGLLIYKGDYLLLEGESELLIVDSIINGNIRGHRNNEKGISFSIEPNKIQYIALVSCESQLPV